VNGLIVEKTQRSADLDTGATGLEPSKKGEGAQTHAVVRLNAQPLGCLPGEDDGQARA
jgi:hypothetical protein